MGGHTRTGANIPRRPIGWATDPRVQEEHLGKDDSRAIEERDGSVFASSRRPHGPVSVLRSATADGIPCIFTFCRSLNDPGQDWREHASKRSWTAFENRRVAWVRRSQPTPLTVPGGRASHMSSHAEPDTHLPRYEGKEGNGGARCEVPPLSSLMGESRAMTSHGRVHGSMDSAANGDCKR